MDRAIQIDPNYADAKDARADVLAAIKLKSRSLRLPKKRFWKKLIAAWEKGHPASQVELSTRYLQLWPESGSARIVLANALINFRPL